MQDFEKLGVFYLGREYDPEKRKGTDNLLLYDSKDLVTHAVCVGMTGSGKTGLCIDLLEEAAIDNIPALLIDPKGDLANLLLTFPDLKPEDFSPWINEDEATQKGMTPAAYAAQQAELWKKGLAGWGQDSARIARLRDAAEFSIYTPGSAAGLQVSILRSFGAPPAAMADDREAMRDRVSATATALLALLGIDADPVKSREHILLSNILDNAWRAGQDLDLAAIIQRIQTPPFQRIGVLDLEAFYPDKDRFELAMSLNNLLAAPGFEAWMEGEPLDIGAMLRTRSGKPRVTIFSIAHLNDTERMFFVSLLLNEVLNWTRAQSGTTSLRAIVYMDEIYGYFPPIRNPPSKGPLLTLLKQARAFGVGVVLATQNPVDLDYKGLANAGTWFIGRLQTERDKARLLDGLQSAAEAGSQKFDRAKIEDILSSLGSRVFMMNNVHEDQPVVFESRWALSYLRGPLTRTQIKSLMDPRKAAAASAAAKSAVGTPAVVPRAVAAGTAAAQAPTAPAPAAAAPVAAAQPRPTLTPDISQLFLTARGAMDGLAYYPTVAGSAQIHFIDDKSGVDLVKDLWFLTPVTTDPVPVKWENALELNADSCDLEKEPAPGLGFADLPAPGGKAKNYDAWKRDFVAWIYANQRTNVLKSPSSGELSKPGESERDFRARLQQTAREDRDAAVEAIRQKYAAKVASLNDRILRAQQKVEKEQQQATGQKVQAALQMGGAILGAFFGRKTLSRTNIGAVTSAARTVGRTYKETQDVGMAGESLVALQQAAADLQNQIKQETDELAAKTDPATEELETVTIRPKKTGISVRLFSLVWAPFRQEQPGADPQPAWE
jgi:hypothetical protein